MLATSGLSVKWASNMELEFLLLEQTEKQSSCRWFETPWHKRDVTVIYTTSGLLNSKFEIFIIHLDMTRHCTKIRNGADTESTDFDLIIGESWGAYFILETTKWIFLI